MNRHPTAGQAEANSQSRHHELLQEILQEKMGQLVDRERVLISENDQLRRQLVEMKEGEKKKYDDLLVQYRNIKREYEDGTEANRVTLKTESNDEYVKVEIKEELKEENDEDDHDHDCDRYLAKKEVVSDDDDNDDDNSMQIDDPANVDEVVQPNHPNDIPSHNQLNSPTNFECAPSANNNEPVQVTNSSVIEQSVDQQVDSGDHEPANKRTRVSSLLDHTEIVEEVTTAVGVGLTEMNEENGGGRGEGEGLQQSEDDETEIDEGEEESGHYKIKILKLKCTEDGCNCEVGGSVELRDHLRVVHRLSPCRCLAEGCGERFEQWDELGRHVQNNHSNISSWPCAQCTKTFKSQRLLYKHLYYNHFEGQFQCDYGGCHYDRVATRRIELKNHQMSVHPSPATVLTCQYPNCRKTYSHKSNFNIHQQSHTGDKPFACDWFGCDKSFITKQSLTIHQRIHQQVKPFKCTWNECHYSSTQQSAVVTHIRIKHFRLPVSQKKQRELGIEDNRNPFDYLQHERNSPV